MPELKRLIDQAKKTGTQAQLEAVLTDLENLIVNGLTTKLTSSNPEFKTITGNLYQSLQLFSRKLGGFRSARENLFVGINIKEKVVADYGSNLGEISRMAARLGAAQVNSYEYEPYFVLIARLINVLLGHENIRTYLADISTQEPYTNNIDIAVALSVDTFISSKLANIAEHTRELFVYESHALEKSVLIAIVQKLMSHFSHVALVDIFDHGQGLRSWRAFFLASQHPLDETIHARFSETQSGIRWNIDLTRSDFVFFDRQSINSASWNQHVSRAEQDLQGIDAAILEKTCEQVASEGIAGSKLYWAAFTLGLDQAKRGVQLEDNFYFLLLNLLIDRGIYDQMLGALRASQLDDFRNRVRTRLGLFAVTRERLQPVTLNGLWSATETNVTRAGNSICFAEFGDNYSALIFDGFHRLYAALLAGLPTCPVQCILMPQVDNLKKWKLDLEEMLSVTTSCIESKLLDSKITTDNDT